MTNSWNNKFYLSLRRIDNEKTSTGVRRNLITLSIEGNSKVFSRRITSAKKRAKGATPDNNSLNNIVVIQTTNTSVA